MPLIKIQHIAEGTALAIWEATESIDFFLGKLSPRFLTGFDNQRFSENRKKEFLATRFLVKQLSGSATLRLETRQNGKTAIAEGTHHLSLSHSNEMMAAILSEKFKVGIDIEEIHPRVKKVMSKFLNEPELCLLGSEPELWKIILCWSAKESLYKMLEQPGLSFRNNILLDIPPRPDSGKLKALLSTGGEKKEAYVYFEVTGKYILSYCMDS
ncbi:MAG TPA: 4'-phosphopantetheinyl transferase superfamily protein [Chitinophagales bacterium]|nr:4'-phosphopantetheinyl transferase superfamily protein [Chitinophagales bacterium]